jgi:hypothetical protein
VSGNFTFQYIGMITLDPGDEVSSVTWFREYAIVVTKRGAVIALYL